MPTFPPNDEKRIYYIDENPTGSPVVVLLHGLGVNSKSWSLQFPALTKSGYRTIAPDLPGFGQSNQVPFRGIQQVSCEIAAMLQILTSERVFLVGISMGGILALQLTLDHPQVVAKLVLVNSMAKLDLNKPLMWPYYFWRYLLIQTKGLETQAEVVAERLFPAPDDNLFRQATVESIMEADLASYRTAMKSIARYNAEKRLTEIGCPILVITGENDTTIPLSIQRHMAGRIPRAVHILIKDAGHAVTIDQAEHFNCAVLEFLNDQPISTNATVQVIQ